MTCRDVIEFLMDYLSGELTPVERAVFEKHLAECPACVSYLETYQETIRLGKASMIQTEQYRPSDAPEELVQAILAARSPR